jgi:dipeptidyl-peptidase-4
MSRLLLVLLVGSIGIGVAVRGVGHQEAGARADGGQDRLLTVAEDSGFSRTASHAEVMAFVEALDGLSDRVHVEQIGESVEGKPIPAMVIADPPVRTPEQARKGGRAVAMMLGNIHAGEVCGKEALLMLARDLALTDEHPLLKDLVVVIVPIYNPDGNDRFSPDNRPGQVGPDEMGVRPNAQGLDLNRDFVKMEAPETRALVRAFNRWDPWLFIDTHTTNGSHHRNVITYEGPKNPAGDAELIRFVRDEMLPDVTRRLKEATGYDSFFYGNFREKNTQWRTYPSGPRYGVGYFGMKNRLAILSEAYSYATYEDRVRGTLGFCESCLHFVAENKGKIKGLVEGADRRARDGGEGRLPLQTRAVAADGKRQVLGYEEFDADGNRVEPGEEKTWEVDHFNVFEPTLEVERAWGYLVPAERTDIVELLQRHGIEIDIVREDIELEGHAYRIDGFDRREREYQGHRLVGNVEATALARTVRVKSGWYLVRTGQRWGGLASYLLEPMAEDGLVTWGFFGDELDRAEHPIIRLNHETALTTRSARPLDEDRETGKQITYEGVYERGERINLNGSAVRGLRWEDDGEHYIQRKGNATYRVHAPTGRAEALERTESNVADRLVSLPTVNADDARSIARRWFRGGDGGVVFEHGSDLYWAEADGSDARRLTSTPGPEELWTLSPDGAFVAFVRDNNLWVVDVATANERALTEGGHDDLRYGKATWVYYEEVFNRRWRTFWWSPDSENIVFYETDSSMIPWFTIVADDVEPQRVERARFPKPGQKNPDVRVGIAPRSGGPINWVDLSLYTEGAYLVTGAGWTPDGKNVRLYLQDRTQTWLDHIEVGTRGGEPRRLYRDRTEAWIEPPSIVRYLDDGTALISSPRDGYRHLYHYAKDGALLGRVTEGEWEVRAIEHVDEANGWVYFMGMAESPIAPNLYRVKLDGTGMERLTDEAGSHSVSISPTGSFFIDTWSSHATPTRVALRNIDGSFVRWIDTNPVYEIEEYDLGEFELVRIESEKGVMLEANVLKPPHFDPEKKYPVWFSTYGGPYAPSIRDRWNHASGGGIWDHVLANEGIVVFHADPHPASAKGHQSAWTAYKRLGVRELEDVVEAMEWLKSHEWIDGTRTGLTGASYGGYMTAFALTHSDVFSAGIAELTPSDWRDYDTVYTERYMLTPMENPEGYEETSLVKAAKKLSGRLLLVHGVIDDNVHMQHVTKLTRAYQRANRPFEIMPYPGSRHGVGGEHARELRMRFIRESLLGHKE